MTVESTNKNKNLCRYTSFIETKPSHTAYLIVFEFKSSHCDTYTNIVVFIHAAHMCGHPNICMICIIYSVMGIIAHAYTVNICSLERCARLFYLSSNQTTYFNDETIRHWFCSSLLFSVCFVCHFLCFEIYFSVFHLVIKSKKTKMQKCKSTKLPLRARITVRTGKHFGIPFNPT